VLADDIDGTGNLDLIVSTMNGNIFALGTTAEYHPLKTWTGQVGGALEGWAGGLGVFWCIAALRCPGGRSSQPSRFPLPLSFKPNAPILSPKTKANQNLIQTVHHQMQATNGLVARYNYFGAFATLQSRVARDVAGQSMRVRVCWLAVEGRLLAVGCFAEGDSDSTTFPKLHTDQSNPPNQHQPTKTNQQPTTKPTTRHASPPPPKQVSIEIVDKRATLSKDGAILNATQGGPYNVTVVLKGVGVAEMNAGEAPVIGVADTFNAPGVHVLELPCPRTRTTATVRVDLHDGSLLHFQDEFALSFHVHFHKLLKYMVALPLLGMAAVALAVAAPIVSGGDYLAYDLGLSRD